MLISAKVVEATRRPRNRVLSTVRNMCSLGILSVGVFITWGFYHLGLLSLGAFITWGFYPWSCFRRGFCLRGFCLRGFCPRRITSTVPIAITVIINHYHDHDHSLSISGNFYLYLSLYLSMHTLACVHVTRVYVGFGRNRV